MVRLYNGKQPKPKLGMKYHSEHVMNFYGLSIFWFKSSFVEITIL